MNRNSDPERNPWYQHCRHGRLFLFNRILRRFLCFFDYRYASEEFIPINHQGKVAGYRIHLFPQCFCTTDFSTGNSWPYSKRRVYASSWRKTSISKYLASCLAKLNLVGVIQIGKVNLKYAFFSIIAVFVIKSGHLPGKYKIIRFFFSGRFTNAPAGICHLFKHISGI